MKFIDKKLANEPSSLKSYRETTPNASFKGFGDADHLLKQALLNEQGHLCAYCMKRISLKRSSLGRDEQTIKPMIEVEHYESQDEFPEKSLIYSNMLGVCNGFSQGDIHCDKRKLELRLKVINPLKKEVEELITYSNDGSILAAKDIENVSFDLNEILNLNNRNLKLARQEAIDLARKLLADKYPTSQWTKAIIQKEIEEWNALNKGGKFRPFCRIAIWFWEQQKMRNRYPAK